VETGDGQTEEMVGHGTGGVVVFVITL